MTPEEADGLRIENAALRSALRTANRTIRALQAALALALKGLKVGRRDASATPSPKPVEAA